MTNDNYASVLSSG